MTDRLSHLVEEIGALHSRPVVSRVLSPQPSTALVFDVGRLTLLGALTEMTMGQLVWGDGHRDDSATALYEFRESGLIVHDVVRNGVLEQVDQTIEVESWDPFGRNSDRHWLICPNQRDGEPCRRRASKLLLVDGETQPKCRRCVGGRRRLREVQLTAASAHKPAIAARG
jgi:hypothetical protein